MKIISIEPTPSPNTMKINLNEELPMGKSNNYKKDQAAGAPKLIQKLFEIDGVKGVYHVADFLAIERNAKFDWKEILHEVRAVFGEDTETVHGSENQPNEHYGEVKVLVQMFKGIPMQVKLSDGNEERRFGLPEEYFHAVRTAEQPGDNIVVLRKWHDYGVRYGELADVGKEVVEELIAAFPKERLKNLVDRAQQQVTDEVDQQREKLKLSTDMLDEHDWRKRYQLLEQMADPLLEDLPLLEKALDDEKVSIRRLATVYLGMIEDRAVLPLLQKALRDKAVSVRRTAGDCLSDLGFPEASQMMMGALTDKSKLVRWRAAMFLYEVGDEQALPALKACEDDREFEVSMQIKLAIERIEGGEVAKGSVWKQMTEVRKK